MSYSIPDNYSQFEKLGHPGSAYKVIEYNSGQLDLTGSNYGYGGVRVVEHGAATASLSGGGQVLLLDFTSGTRIWPLSISKIHGGSSAKVYLFKVQGQV